ncbi:hypothetical protein ABZ319_34670 [Nocardia sp. NPDC005978]|uniref:hypothetical protein n=1 Tax=Nocardia sp. NPDC005978 TaxID=3156725 RepID=UPI0033B6A2DC
MNRTVQLRLSGDLGDITMVLATLLAAKQFRLVVDETPYPNRKPRRGDRDPRPGVRVYVDLQMPPARTSDDSEGTSK